MRGFSHPLVYIPWSAMILCEIALFVLLWKSEARRRYRGFEAYVACTLCTSLVLLGISLWGDRRGYFVAYYLGAFLKTFALGLAVYEQYKSVFFPRWSMSDRVLRLIMGTLCGTVLLSIGLAALTPQATPAWDLAIARRIVSLSDYLLCGSMGLLLLYAEFLKVERPQRAQAIVRGLIATSILGITSSLMLAVSGTLQLAGLVGFSTTIGFVAVLISWILAFRKPELVVLEEPEESPLDELAPGSVHAVVSHMLMWKL